MTKPKCKCPPGSPFHWKDDDRPSIFVTAKLENSLNNSIKQTAHIERERINGRDISHVAGLSKKSHAQRLISVKQFTVYSRAGQIL
jgi:hypothetical protein